MGKIKWQRGFFRIYIVWDFVWAIVFGVVSIDDMPPSRKDFYIIVSVILLPWVIHCIVKWIIMGFRDTHREKETDEQETPETGP